MHTLFKLNVWWHLHRHNNEVLYLNMQLICALHMRCTRLKYPPEQKRPFHKTTHSIEITQTHTVVWCSPFCFYLPFVFIFVGWLVVYLTKILLRYHKKKRKERSNKNSIRNDTVHFHTSCLCCDANERDWYRGQFIRKRKKTRKKTANQRF